MKQAQVVDLGIKLPRGVRAGLKVLHARRHDGAWVSHWKHSKVMDATCHHLLSRAVAARQCDAVLEIQDLAAPDIPFFVYQDFSYEALLRTHQDGQAGIPHFPAFTRDQLRRRRDRQHTIYERATGIFVMSEWLARALTDWSGVPSDKVHVIYPGRSAMELASSITGGTPERDGRRRRRLLFVGRDFHTKGGDVVVEALRLLRQSFDPEMTLTVAGPVRWPLQGEVPRGVTFLGPLPVEEVLRLYTDHDLLVMPSRLEGFGIVFVEALAHGLPCVARRAFAMPEIVVDGHNGALVDTDDPTELAAVIARTLESSAIYDTCRTEIPEVVARFSWDRAAADMVSAIEMSLGIVERRSDSRG